MVLDDVDAPEGVTVILVNKFNKTQELKRKEHVKTKNGRIPLRDICKEWNLRNVVWVETDDPVTYDEKTGWSSLSFAFMDPVILKGDISLINQEKLAKEHMDKEFKKKPLGTSSSPSKGLDIVVSTEEKPIAPTYNERMCSSLVVASSVVIENKKPTTSATVNVHSSSSSEDVLSQIEKLAELKQKGILSEEEFTQKKKQLLGL
ncbi:hypothetical protein C9374_006288 [Naegleria lovaniensis]|uniref:SHOCT domain-containing protein n=1 Tax=Naegleria lovaniensis TaxID=51637 RepID=A0AA88GHV9_NAELO|nr:uncharacterized protein C9374_006288 [Naegleria lovaniensis]KAG2381299.1 hypothetical protein C9374_006288 [Naegleria lovaniensis]